MAATKDGYTWSPSTGTQAGGLKTQGVILPPQHISSPPDTLYDAIVIGAGYAGLRAARDLLQSGTSATRLSVALANTVPQAAACS